MHISDGVLNAPVCIGSAAVALAVMAYSLKKMGNDHIPRISVMTAAFFVASLIHVRIGPASGHLVLNGLVGIFFGTSAFPAILVALLFQAIMFQHGGITTLGVNAIAMGVPAFLAYGIFRFRVFVKPKKTERNSIDIVFSFIAGFIAIFVSAFFVFLFILSAGSEFVATARIVLYAHLPIALIEGIITVFIVSFMKKVKPEILAN